MNRIFENELRGPLMRLRGCRRWDQFVEQAKQEYSIRYWK